MKVVCVFGSPRANGNSHAIAEGFLEKIREQGGDVESFHLNRLTYKGCQGCQVCKTKLDHCVLKDDLREVLEKTAEADVLVVATPVYYGDVSSQLKGFIDRTYSYLVPDFYTSETPCRLKPGKTLVFVITQAGPEKSFDDVFPRYGYFFKFYGYKDQYLIRGCDLSGPEEASVRESLMLEAETAALKILG